MSGAKPLQWNIALNAKPKTGDRDFRSRLSFAAARRSQHLRLLRGPRCGTGYFGPKAITEPTCQIVGRECDSRQQPLSAHLPMLRRSNAADAHFNIRHRTRVRVYCLQHGTDRGLRSKTEIKAASIGGGSAARTSTG